MMASMPKIVVMIDDAEVVSLACEMARKLREAPWDSDAVALADDFVAALLRKARKPST